MTTITLETVHQDIVELKKTVESLKECLHEDFLDISKQTHKDIEESREQIKKGKYKILEL